MSSERPTRVPTKEQSEAPKKPALQKFKHDFFSPEIAHLRKIYFRIIGMFVVLLILMMWICLPVYWGSLWKANVLTENLRAWVIDRDGGPVGQAVTQGILDSLNSGSRQVLGWRQIDSSEFASDEGIANAVVDERTWMAVVIENGASANLDNARVNGDSSYNPASAISVYYAQARNEIATGSFAVPITTALLGSVVGQFNARSTGEYLGSISGNSTAVELLSRAPQTVSQPIYWTMRNLRPFTTQVATAITLVGQIYVIIFAFFITMAGGGAREVIAPYLNLKSYLKMRLIVPVIMYLPLSLFYSMINLPFKLPFDAKYTYAGGFFLFWCLIYVSMVALGLATEAVFTILGPRFMGFFLIPYIIINISVTVLPNEVQVWFYKYGYGFPIFNASQATRTIIFNTKNHLGRNFGVIIAWAVLSAITVPLFSILMRRKEEAEEKKKLSPASIEEQKIEEMEDREAMGIDKNLEKDISRAEVLDRVSSADHASRQL